MEISRCIRIIFGRHSGIVPRSREKVNNGIEISTCLTLHCTSTDTPTFRAIFGILISLFQYRLFVHQQNFHSWSTLLYHLAYKLFNCYYNIHYWILVVAKKNHRKHPDSKKINLLPGQICSGIMRHSLNASFLWNAKLTLTQLTRELFN